MPTTQIENQASYMAGYYIIRCTDAALYTVGLQTHI